MTTEPTDNEHPPIPDNGTLTFAGFTTELISVDRGSIERAAEDATPECTWIAIEQAQAAIPKKDTDDPHPTTP